MDHANFRLKLCFLRFGYLHEFIMFYFLSFFLKKQKIIDLKKGVWPKFYCVIFLFLLKIGSVGPVNQQIDFVTP